MNEKPLQICQQTAIIVREWTQGALNREGRVPKGIVKQNRRYVAEDRIMHKANERLFYIPSANGSYRPSKLNPPERE